MGTAALPEEKYTRLDKIISDMQTIYSTAKICDFKDKDKCDLALEPGNAQTITTTCSNIKYLQKLLTS